jgi:hypothetical protein
VIAGLPTTLELTMPSEFALEEAALTVRVFLLTVNVCVMSDPRREPV